MNLSFEKNIRELNAQYSIWTIL